MFFIDGERLIFRGNNIHQDYLRYNELSRGIDTSKVGEFTVDDVFRTTDRVYNQTNAKRLELSLWRTIDKNVKSRERGLDPSEFVIGKPNGERVSYVIVPRMNTDAKDNAPCEYTDEKDDSFEDINDPRTIIIARSYKGVIAEIAKDMVLKNEKDIRNSYKFLTNPARGICTEFSNQDLLKVLTRQAVKVFEPNVYATKMEDPQQIYPNASQYDGGLGQDNLSNFGVNGNFQNVEVTQGNMSQNGSMQEFNITEVSRTEQNDTPNPNNLGVQGNPILNNAINQSNLAENYIPQNSNFGTVNAGNLNMNPMPNNMIGENILQ